MKKNYKALAIVLVVLASIFITSLSFAKVVSISPEEIQSLPKEVKKIATWSVPRGIMAHKNVQGDTYCITYDGLSCSNQADLETVSALAAFSGNELDIELPDHENVDPKLVKKLAEFGGSKLSLRLNDKVEPLQAAAEFRGDTLAIRTDCLNPKGMKELAKFKGNHLIVEFEIVDAALIPAVLDELVKFQGETLELNLISAGEFTQELAGTIAKFNGKTLKMRFWADNVMPGALAQLAKFNGKNLELSFDVSFPCGVLDFNELASFKGHFVSCTMLDYFFSGGPKFPEYEIDGQLFEAVVEIKLIGVKDAG